MSTIPLPAQTLWIIVAIASLLNLLLTIPIVIYYLIKFNRRSKETVISKRYPVLVQWINIFSLVLLSIRYTLQFITQISPIQDTNPFIYELLERINNLILCIFGYGMLWLYATRFWLMFYDLKCCSSTMNKQWKVYLNPSLNTKDFWLKHKHNLGSKAYVLRIGICLWFLSAAIYGTSRQLTAYRDTFTTFNAFYNTFFLMSQIFHCLMYFITFMFYTILFCKLPKVLDIFYVGYEMKIITIIQWLYLFVFVSFLIVLHYVTENVFYAHPIRMLSGRLLSIFIGSVIMLLWTLPSTFWILRKIDKNKQNKNITSYSAMQQTMGLQHVLLNNEYFELFVQHLCREFNVENIISFIEFVQFKHVLNEKYHLENNLLNVIDEDGGEEDEEEDVTFFDFFMCDLHKNEAIPKSQMIYHSEAAEGNEITPYLKIAYKLYEKYIKYEGELELNISSEMRQKYIDKMKDKQCFIANTVNALDPMELFEYFDPVMQEMYFLMLASYERFIESGVKVNIARLFLVNHTSTEIRQLI